MARLVGWDSLEHRLVIDRRLIAYTISLGLVLFAIHNPNQPGLYYAFLPQVGFILVLCAVVFLFINTGITKADFGPKYIYIPLAVIAGSIVLSGVLEWSVAGLATVFFGLLLFMVYLAARALGQDVFWLFGPAVVIQAISCVVYGILYPSIRTGGLLSPTNYDIAVGFLVFGLVVSALRRRWWLSAVSLVGLFFTGAEEGIFAIGLVGVTVLIRRDWSRRLWVPISALVVTVAICTPLGITRALYYPSIEKAALAKEAVEETSVGKIAGDVIPDVLMIPLNRIVEPAAKRAGANTVKAQPSEGLTRQDVLWYKATNQRWAGNWQIPAIRPLGYGYNITAFYKGIPHNVPLIIIHQVGPLAAVAWLFVCGWGLFRSRWTYAWVGLVGLSVFDHFVWTQVALWFWALAGVSVGGQGHTDWLFRRGA